MSKKLTLAAAVLLAASFLAGILSGLATGDSAPPLEGVFADNFNLSDPPAPAPTEPFEDLQGRTVTLADFEGRVVVLNFWATWCAPCIREMPSLDRLQAALGAEGLKVIGVSIDRGGREAVEPFMKKLGLEQLEAFLDPKGRLFRAFRAQGVPTTMLIDVEGNVVGSLMGTAEWDSPEAMALIRHYLPAEPPAAGGVVKTGG